MKHLIEGITREAFDRAERLGKWIDYRPDGVLRGGLEYRGYFYYIGPVSQGYKRVRIYKEGEV